MSRISQLLEIKLLFHDFSNMNFCFCKHLFSRLLKNGAPATNGTTTTTSVPSTQVPPTNKKERANWGNDIEFLMSCIAMSVGLGNVWRFPFTALENGGGAFLIPYLIVLLIIGRPLYYMEMLLGQFSSRSSIKVFDLAPAMRGNQSIRLLIHNLMKNQFVNDSQ